MRSDSRRFEGHRASKGAFQQQHVRASLRRSIQQLRRVQPWPAAASGTTKRNETAPLGAREVES